jgi:phospholipid/cholesterol/gamma-HCH transport system ATP-binding protein
MIEFKNITKSFKNKIILNNISGKFEKGKINLIIGTSGTGKSILLKCIVGLITPNNGKIFFDGRNFTNENKNLKVEIRREIGMLFQGSALFDSQDIETNVMFPLNMLTNMSKKEKLERVNFCLKKVGLENINKKFPSEISGGMKKRVGLARAIVNKSKYLFCDEPNSGLDPQTSLKMDTLIQEITYEYNITTIIVTHDMNSVLDIGDFIFFLNHGKKIWEGNLNNIFKSNLKILKNFIFTGNLSKIKNRK